MKSISKTFIALILTLLFNGANVVFASDTKPKQQHIPVFFTTDDNFADYTAVAMTSILYNTDSFVEFYIINNRLNGFNKRRIMSLKDKFDNVSIEFVFVDADKIFKDFGTIGRRLPVETYFKILISTLKPNLDKVIFLDSDIIAFDDITKLYNEDLGGYMLGARLDDRFIQSVPDMKFFKKNLETGEEHKYFNAGVLLIDTKQWRENNVQEKLFEIEKKYRPSLTFHEQHVLNKFFSEAGYMVLDGKYNEYSNCNGNKSTVIKHFLGNDKPLDARNYFIDENKKRLSGCFDYFWSFAEETPFYDTLIRKLSLNLIDGNLHTATIFKERVLLGVIGMVNGQIKRNYIDATIVVSFILSLIVFLSIKSTFNRLKKKK
ncbi:MAG: glycosyltransferase family 8 protein [Rickettsiales bacterium]|jgi:lipopolysaccharide biosynthesis glycosyltransferase|nr:glycosyltransferase family 8 protein [Rickettsiales bacterium]